MRSVSQEWSKASIVALDAGVHLSAITRLMREEQPFSPIETPYTLLRGPFKGFSLPHEKHETNAGHITSELVGAFLITHPHLDHISGFVINTAGPAGTRPKKIAGLPGTIDALKTHIFNNVIWPNLSDEDSGAGVFTYMRLVDGGSPALGDGETQGYSEICNGLLVKAQSISHGLCVDTYGPDDSLSGPPPAFPPYRAVSPSKTHDYTLRAQQYNVDPSSVAKADVVSIAKYANSTGMLNMPVRRMSADEKPKRVVDSTAYFIRDQKHGREVLFLGDVEPDDFSAQPRNLQLWQEAARKIAASTLAAIFIECSYDDSRDNSKLFGHLKPKYVIEELQALGAEVAKVRRLSPRPSPDSEEAETRRPSRDSEAASPGSAAKKRKHEDMDVDEPANEPAEPVRSSTSRGAKKQQQENNKDGESRYSPTDSLFDLELPGHNEAMIGLDNKRKETIKAACGQLSGLKVVLIHIKETLRDDEQEIGDKILSEVRAHEETAQLGCEFFKASTGQDFYF